MEISNNKKTGLLHWGVYFILFSNMFRTLGTVSIGFLSLNQFVTILMFLFYFGSKILNKERFYKLEDIDIVLIIFGVYFWASYLLINPNSYLAHRICMDYFRSLTTYFLVVLLIIDRDKVKLLVSTFILASFCMVLSGEIYSAIKGGVHFTNRYLSSRTGTSGLAEHYNLYSLYALMSFPLIYFSQKNIKNKTQKILLLFSSFILIAGALFSGSRGAIVAFVFMLSFILVLQLKSVKKIRIAYLYLFLIVGFLGFSFFWKKGGRELISSLIPLVTGDGVLDISLQSRLWLAKRSISFFFENPVFGIGIGATAEKLSLVTHNQWLQILTELGLVGISLSLIIVYYIFRNLSISKQFSYESGDFSMVNIINGVMVSIFTIFFWGFFMNVGLIVADKVLFMLIGCARSIKMVASEQQNLLASN